MVTKALMRVHANEYVANYVNIIAEQYHWHLMNAEHFDALDSRITNVKVHNLDDL